MAQYGFFFDQSRCTGCQSCAVQCKDWNDIPPGPAKALRIFKWEKGTFPNVRVHMLFAPCYHCENPVCVDAAGGTMYKEEKYGAVLIDPDKATSPALKAAAVACPYGAVVFDSDAPDAKAYLCNMCIDRLEQGKQPQCVMACYMRALDFGPLDEMKQKYGSLNTLEDMPSPDIAKPAIVFKPMDKKKDLIPYNTNRAIELLRTRDSEGLSKIYETTEDVTNIPEGTVRLNKLVMKPKSSEEVIFYTKDYEA